MKSDVRSCFTVTQARLSRPLCSLSKLLSLSIPAINKATQGARTRNDAVKTISLSTRDDAGTKHRGCGREASPLADLVGYSHSERQGSGTQGRMWCRGMGDEGVCGTNPDWEGSLEPDS